MHMKSILLGLAVLAAASTVNAQTQTWRQVGPSGGTVISLSADPNNISKLYLGKFISTPSDWTPLKHYSNFFRGYNQPQLDIADPWQFKNFLITEGD